MEKGNSTTCEFRRFSNFDKRQGLLNIHYEHERCSKGEKYCRNFSGDSLGQVETVDIDDVTKWRKNYIAVFTIFF